MAGEKRDSLDEQVVESQIIWAVRAKRVTVVYGDEMLLFLLSLPCLNRGVAIGTSSSLKKELFSINHTSPSSATRPVPPCTLYKAVRRGTITAIFFSEVGSNDNLPLKVIGLTTLVEPSRNKLLIVAVLVTIFLTAAAGGVVAVVLSIERFVEGALGFV